MSHSALDKATSAQHKRVGQSLPLLTTGAVPYAYQDTVLVSSWTEVIFFVVFGMMLYFVSSIKEQCRTD